MQEYTSGSKKKLHRDFDENSDNEHLLAKRYVSAVLLVHDMSRLLVWTRDIN